MKKKKPAPHNTQGAGLKLVHLNKFNRKKNTEAQMMPSKALFGLLRHQEPLFAVVVPCHRSSFVVAHHLSLFVMLLVSLVNKKFL